MKTHAIGDKVRVNCPGSSEHGKECRVTSLLAGDYVRRPQGMLFMEVQDVDLPRTTSGRIFAFPPDELVPLYDGRETVSWSECVWQPRTLKV